MNNEIQVTERMAAFIEWANEKGQDEIRRLIRERLAMLKEECERNNGHADSDGFRWDDALEPNDGIEQWKHGGDCNMCRKVKFCMKQCRPNRLLKEITTTFLYQCYLEEHPEVAAGDEISKLTPEDVVKKLGIQ